VHIHAGTDRWINLGQLFDAQARRCKPSAHSTVLFRDFDAHEAVVKQTLDDALVHDAGAVHLSDVWCNFFLRKPCNHVFHHHFVLAEEGDREPRQGLVGVGTAWR